MSEIVAENGFFVVGDEELVIGFRFAGIAGRAARTRDEALEAFAEAKSSGAQVAVFTENVADLVRRELVGHQLSGDFPLLVEIPPLEGEVRGRKTLLESIREAVGVSV